MKRTLSLVLATLMVFSCFCGLSVFAATTEIVGAETKNQAKNINYDIEYGITLPSSQTQWFKFTTKNSLNYWYNISVQNVTVGNNNGFQGVSGAIYDSFGECLSYASAYNGGLSSDGVKLEPSTTYYIAVYGCRAGKIKFWLNADVDVYSETKAQATEILIGNTYESSIDSCGGLTDDRTEDGLGGDVDYVKFKTGVCNKIKFTLYNSDVDYYNTYFEGVVGKIVDSFGSTHCYLEVRPDSRKEAIVVLEANTTYYIKFFSTSGSMGKYKFIVEYAHTPSDWIITPATTNAPGLKYKNCTVCGAVLESEVVPQIELATPVTKATNTLIGINVTWNAVPNAVKYVVYRRLGTSSTWEIIATTTGTSFTDNSKLTAGSYYIYSVKAYNSANIPSDYVKENTATVQRVVAPYTKATNALDGVNVTWGKVAGANKYVVLRRIGTESTWKILGETTGTSFVDKNVKSGVYYIYSIRAVNGTGYSAYDVNKRFTIQRVVAPYTKAANAANGINVTWSKVAGATKYVVLRRIGTESTWKVVGQTTGTAFLDKNVTPGIYYIYSIRAVNGTGYSAYDINKRFTIQYITAPTAKAYNKSSGVQVSWNSVAGAKKYNVYRRAAGSSTWVYVGTTTSTTLLDRNVIDGKYYAYSIRAINGTGYSAYNSSKCVTIKHI